tara:strand:+ start:327 stop:575 length:249 start_codon:yes stop_codon:yes gene_type:complete
MKIFEIEFVHDDYNKRESADTGTRKNPFRVRMMFPRDEQYNKDYWSYNHRVMRDEFDRVYNPTINGSTYERKYCVQAIRRVR